MWAYGNLLRESTPFTRNDDIGRFDPFIRSRTALMFTSRPPHREHAFFHTPKLRSARARCTLTSGDRSQLGYDMNVTVKFLT